MILACLPHIHIRPFNAFQPACKCSNYRTGYFRLINVDEIAEMDALFLTSTSLQLIPIRQVDHMNISVAERCTQKIWERFEIIKNDHLKQTNINS